MLGFLASPLAASSGSSSSGGGSLGSILIFLVPMGLILYFLILRPQRRQRQARQQLIDSIDVGDEVVTIGGAYGTVRSMDEDSLSLEVAPGVEIRFSRGAIARKMVYDDADEDDLSSTDEADLSSPDEDEDQDGSDGDEQDESDGSRPAARDWRQGPWFGRSSRRRRNEGAGEQS